MNLNKREVFMSPFFEIARKIATRICLVTSAEYHSVVAEPRLGSVPTHKKTYVAAAKPYAMGFVSHEFWFNQCRVVLGVSPQGEIQACSIEDWLSDLANGVHVYVGEKTVRYDVQPGEIANFMNMLGNTVLEDLLVHSTEIRARMLVSNIDVRGGHIRMIASNAERRVEMSTLLVDVCSPDEVRASLVEVDGTAHHTQWAWKEGFVGTLKGCCVHAQFSGDPDGSTTPIGKPDELWMSQEMVGQFNRRFFYTEPNI